MPEEIIKKTPGSDHSFAPFLINSCPLLRARFSGNYLINNSIFAFREVIHLYIPYILYT